MIAETFKPAAVGYAQMLGPKRRPLAVTIRTASADQAEAFVEIVRRTGSQPLEVVDYRRMIRSPCIAAWTLSVSQGGQPRLAGFAMARWADAWVEHFLLALDVDAGRARRFALGPWAEHLVRFAEGRTLFADVPHDDLGAVSALIDAGFNRRGSSWGVHHGLRLLSRLHRPAAEGMAP